MRKLPIKGTNISFSSLGIGTGTGFNKESLKSQKDFFLVFDAAFESGINWLDTAESYADGYAENLIGEYGKISKKNFYVASKFSPKNASKELLIKSCEDSLKRLKRECIDLYQIHWMNYSIPIEETIQALEKLKNDGKIRAIGVSNFNIKELENINPKNFVSNQIEFNLFNRIAENELLEFHKKNDILSIAYSPFNGINNLSSSSKKKVFLNNLVNKYSATPQQIILSFLNTFENLLVTYSSTNYKHVKNNNDLIDLTQDDIRSINETFESTIILIDPMLIRIPTGKFYGTLSEAKDNKYSYYPGIKELSEEFLSNDNFKPIKVRKIEDEKYSFELTGGMMRYWAWVNVYKSENLIEALVTN